LSKCEFSPENRSITSLEASALTSIASVHTRLGNKQLSLDFHHEAKELFQSAGDKDGEAAQLVNIAIAQFNFGEKQAALDYANQGLELTNSSIKPEGRQ